MPVSRRTKIVCTLGPASETPAAILGLVRAGMDVARLNFSHGTHASHARLIRGVRAAARACAMPVAVLADLQGPKVRLGVLPEAGVDLVPGHEVVFSTSETVVRDGRIPVTYRRLYADVAAGHRILIDDGRIELRVTEVAGTRIRAVVRVGGCATSHKGMNFPDSAIRLPALTQKDKEDLAFAVARGVDWIALSFVARAEDIVRLRRLIARLTSTPPRILAKIETAGALDRFDEILAAADGILIARGDLALETPAEDVPVRQKEIVGACRRAGKPVVDATQMLDSMTRNPRPTRAEVSDVANAVCDHADALMLSGETASGRYPRQAVALMSRVIADTEASVFDDLPFPPAEDPGASLPVADLSAALASMARGGQIHAVLAAVSDAAWPEQVLLARPEIPLFLACPDDRAMRRANLRWGVRPFLLRAGFGLNVPRALAIFRDRKWVKRSMRLAVVSGDENGLGFDVVKT